MIEPKNFNEENDCDGKNLSEALVVGCTNLNSHEVNKIIQEMGRDYKGTILFVRKKQTRRK